MLKINTNTLAPIAISIILPVLSLFTNEEIVAHKEHGFFIQWAFTSLCLFILWHLLWYISNLKNKIKYWGIVLTFVLFIGFLNFVFIKVGQEFSSQKLVRVIFGLTLLLIIQYALKAQQNIANLLLEKEQIQTENYKAQLKTLQAKIDPHFLFNSLNTLRSMVRQQHANSEKFIISLSDLYRQTLQYKENTTLPLAKEIVVLESYLFLMQNRNEKAIKIKLQVEESLHNLHLPTLALQVIVENCFKHNSMTTKNPLHIEIKNVGDRYIEVTNNIQPKIGETESSGYGLDLLKKRYELLDVKNGIIIEETSDQFRVKLKLIKK